MRLVTGIDVQSIGEVKESLTRFGDRYRTRLYSERELDECAANLERTAESLAVRFAAKEAVIKVLEPHDHIPSWRTIEVLLRTGGPTIVLNGEAEDLARHKGVETMSLSVSVARDHAIAAVVAVTLDAENGRS